MQLNELKRELQFNTDLLGLIETLKNVAAAQYHVMEKQKERFDQFMDAFSGFFRVVNLVDVEDPLVKVTSDVLGIIIVTSDSGFMGGLNGGVMRNAMAAQGERPNDKVSLVIIGDKGGNAFSDKGRNFKFFPGIQQETIYEQAVEIKDYVVGEVLAGRMGKVVLSYARALSFSSQDISLVNILPCAELFDMKADSEVAKHLKGAQKMMADAQKVIIESTYSDIVEYLAGVWVASKLYEVFEDSKMAEFSARAMHLEGSVQKIEKEHGKVQHKVFKAVHENIDKQMRESHSAKTLVNKKKKKKKKKMRELAAEIAAEAAAEAADEAQLS